MSNNSLIETSLYFNFSYAYFAQMRLNNEEKFNEVFGSDENQIRSVIKYAESIEDLVLKMEEILNTMSSVELANFLFDNEILAFKNTTQAYRLENEAVFRIRENESDFISINYRTVKKWRKMIEAFEKVSA